LVDHWLFPTVVLTIETLCPPKQRNHGFIDHSLCKALEILAVQTIGRGVDPDGAVWVSNVYHGTVSKIRP
jgi:hypothetical protein